MSFYTWLRMDEGEILLIPGPVSVEPEVLEALSHPVRAHYGADWARFYRDLTGSLARIFKTETDPLLLFGPGTAAIEAAFASTLSRGDEVAVVTNGLFGERMVDVAAAMGLEVHLVTGDDDFGPVAPERLEEVLRRQPRVRAAGFVHHETSLGLVNPVQELCEVAGRRDVLTIVDAVSSLGGMDLEVDDWGIDLCVTVANKCLGGPVGIAPLTVSQRGWDAVDDGRAKAAGWYLNLRTWRAFGEMWKSSHPHPTTMPTSVLEALDRAVRSLLSTGLEQHKARQAATATRVREGLRELDFEMLVADQHASPVCTAVWGRPGMDVDDYLQWLRLEHGLRLGGGIGRLQGRLFRVGHMGRAADPAVADAYLKATAEYLELTA
jgi:alanine-glyoxylate transaminase / serine-glyoxylate transaminase / serine-pyruvate transaminase